MGNGASCGASLLVIKIKNMFFASLNIFYLDFRVTPFPVSSFLISWLKNLGFLPIAKE